MENEQIHRTFQLAEKARILNAAIPMSMRDIHTIPPHNLTAIVNRHLAEQLAITMIEEMTVNNLIVSRHNDHPVPGVLFDCEAVILSRETWTSIVRVLMRLAKESGYDPLEFYRGI